MNKYDELVEVYHNNMPAINSEEYKEWLINVLEAISNSAAYNEGYEDGSVIRKATAEESSVVE